MLPRDVLIFDSQYPLRTDVRNPFVAIHVVLSDAWLRRWIPNPHVLTARRIPGNSLWGLALSSYVSELSPDLTAAPPLPLSVMADQVGSLIALTASGIRDATLALTPAVRSLCGPCIVPSRPPTRRSATSSSKQERASHCEC